MNKCNNIELEYSIFKFKMLSKTSHEIYDSCNIIRFYECVHEYLLYNENVSAEFMDHIKIRNNVLEELYEIYLKYESLRIDSWDEIDNLIDIYNKRYDRKNISQKKEVLC